jgi:hypothetical protein
MGEHTTHDEYMELLSTTHDGPMIHTAVLSGVDKATHTPVEHFVVWLNARATCPGCDQSDRPVVRDIPVMVDDRGDIQAVSQQHGCGSWWGPDWDSIKLGSDDDDDRKAVITHALVRQAEENRSADRQVVKESLESDIRWVLSLVNDTHDPDIEDLDDLRLEMSTGNEANPGVYFDDDKIVAWTYDPWSEDMTEPELITVTETVR